MIEKVTKITTAAEEITDELTHSAGMIITKITPLLAPLASGFCTLFAFYDGGARLIADKLDHPQAVALGVGIVLMAVVEGINFASTFNRDRAEKSKAFHALGFVSMDSLVNQCFWLTVAVIFALETLPGAVGWYNGLMPITDFVFRAGLLILPFFGKAGAKIFSVSMILDELEGVQEQRRAKRLQAKREEAELAIDLDAKRQETALRLAQLEAENRQRLEIERMRAEAKLSNPVQKSVKPERQLDTDESTKEIVKSGVLDTTRQRLDKLLDTLLDVGWPGVVDIKDRLGVSRQTVYNDLKTLENEGKIVIVRDADNKIVTVTLAIASELPEAVLYTNGVNHH